MLTYNIRNYFNKIIEHINKNKDVLFSILKPIANYRGIKTEIECATKTLKGGEDEIVRESPSIVEHLVVFYPTNVLLYSYILYVIIPSIFFKKITIRPSHRDMEITEAVHEFFLPLLSNECEINLLRCHQRKFISLTENANVVVHTGQYENTLRLKEFYKNSLFLYFGSGTNPFIIGRHSDIKKSVEDAIESRLNNSGQDCMCQDCHFVHETVFDEFLTFLTDKIKNFKFGATHEDVDYSHIVYDSVFGIVQNFYSQNEKFCIHKGKCSIEERRIDPFVFCFDKVKNLPYINEFFAPIFVIIKYSSDHECNDWLLSERQLERSMGLSVYGNINLHPKVFKHYIVSNNQSFMYLEDGNLPFGGYGRKSSIISYNGEEYSKPILISRKVRKFFGREDYYI